MEDICSLLQVLIYSTKTNKNWLYFFLLLLCKCCISWCNFNVITVFCSHDVHTLTLVHVCVCLCLCVYLPPSVVVSMCVWMCVTISLSMCLYVCVNAWMHTYVYFTSLYIRVPLHAYVRQRVRICLCVCMHVYVSDVQQVRRGRRSCWHARSIGHVRKDRPMRTARPPRTVAASLPSFTLSASTCSVPFWWVQWQDKKNVNLNFL